MQVPYQVILEDSDVDVFLFFFKIVFVFSMFPFVSGLLFCVWLLFSLYTVNTDVRECWHLGLIWDKLLYMQQINPDGNISVSVYKMSV